MPFKNEIIKQKNGVALVAITSNTTGKIWRYAIMIENEIWPGRFENKKEAELIWRDYAS